MNTVLRYSIFSDNPFGHGGEKRTAQISEILTNNNIPFTYLPDLARQRKSIKLIVYFIRSLFISLKNLKKYELKVNLNRWLRFSYHMATYMCLVYHDEKFSNKIFLWEATKPQFLFIPIIMKLNNCKVIGLPHNLESLVPEQVSFISNVKSPFWLYEEVRFLKICEMIYTISKEETLLLKQFQVDAKYLPYYPVRSIHKQLLNIKEKRNNRKKGGKTKILLIGSVINQSTKIGMINRIQWFQRHIVENVVLIIAGYGSEIFSKFQSENIIIQGTLSSLELEELLVSIDAVLVHHNATSGALTKIIEMMIAGVPIISNFESARNYSQTGIIEYNSDVEFAKILMQKNFNNIFQIESYQRYYNQFVSYIINNSFPG